MDKEALKSFKCSFSQFSDLQNQNASNELNVKKNNLAFIQSELTFENNADKVYGFFNVNYLRHFLKVQSKRAFIFTNKNDYLVEFSLNGQTSRQDTLVFSSIRRMKKEVFSWSPLVIFPNQMFNYFSGNVSLKVSSNSINHSLNIYVGRDDQVKQLVSKLDIRYQRPQKFFPKTLYFEWKDSRRDQKSTENKIWSCEF